MSKTITKEQNEQTMAGNEENQSKFKLWFKRVGFAGFMFFLIKGLVWLGIFAFAWWKARG